MDRSNLKKRYYELNFDKLRDVWHVGMMRALLKAKAKSLCELVPENECIIYGLCAKDSKSVADLANCVVILLDAKQREKIRNEESNAVSKKGIIYYT
ncbi:unnamed protein product [Anisakis simplex]|uniref:DUF1273 family protein n=1 Tax=Anisakis simplex TaxID=6269 RepID=A0A0M3JRQ4_ANISI|nr:unnamed protein product [Anisakis simplex]